MQVDPGFESLPLRSTAEPLSHRDDGFLFYLRSGNAGLARFLETGSRSNLEPRFQTIKHRVGQNEMCADHRNHGTRRVLFG